MNLILHHSWLLLVGYFLFSNAIGAMEKPDEKSGKLYRYVYRLGHGLAGNVKYALRAKFPEFVDGANDPAAN